MDNRLFNQEVKCATHWIGQSELIVLNIHPKHYRLPKIFNLQWQHGNSCKFGFKENWLTFVSLPIAFQTYTFISEI